jgi:uncharacterized integral membrane protein
MRTIRLVLIIIIALSLMILAFANMTPVDLRLLPESLMPGLPVLTGIPVAVVIIFALFMGLVLGFLMEFVREAKDRRKLAEKRREVGELRDENSRLVQRLEEHGDEIGAITQ